LRRRHILRQASCFSLFFISHAINF
jgi:hypothetical protein